MKDVRQALDSISDVVLAYRPKAKQKKARKRKPRNKAKKPEAASKTPHKGTNHGSE
jgi:hypothetical protein